LRVFLYELVRAPGLPASHGECLDWIASQGLPVHRLERRCTSAAEVVQAVEEFGKMRGELPYDIDGAVVKVDDRASRDELGHTSRFPRWAVAFKFEAERAETRLEKITIQVGRTGALTPVAELEPVRLAGTTVSRASLHNEDEIRAKDIRVGDRVVVEKAGEIIPQVVEVVPAADGARGEPFAMPESCPVCGARAVRPEGEARRRCTNRLTCPGQLKGAVIHFARRAAMDIEHLGPSLVDQLVDLDLVRDPADLYSLTESRVEELERMAARSAANLVEGIAASRERSLDRLLGGLGIPLVGEVAARLLAERYGTLSGFAGRDPDTEREELSEIHGIGPKIAESVAEVLGEERFRGVLAKLLEAGIDPPAPEPEGASGPLFGSSFCVTGKLSRPRGDIHEVIRRAGGEVHKVVKKGTTYLVAGDKVGKTKIEKAQKSGALVIDEPALGRLIAGEGDEDGQ